SAEAPDILENVVHNAANDYLTKNKALEPGSRIGNYDVISLLGEGGMGRVYLAHDSRLRRKVAIKTLMPSSAADRAAMRPFEHEPLGASALNHPNILTIYEVGESDGTRFIASEFVDGVTLKSKLTAGPMTAAEAMDIAVQTAAGLNAAHSAGIIHRD